MSDTPPSDPPRSQRHPLRERSESQRNTLAIRLVPYSPPRPDALQSPPPASSASTAISSLDDDTGPSRRTRKFTAESDSHASYPGSALSSASSSLIQLASAHDHGVSASKADPSSSGSRTPTTPAHSSPPYSPSIAAVHAPSQPFLASMPPLEEPTSTSSGHRPLSRRRNLITVHADKTFSLLPLSSRHGNASTSPPSSSPPTSSYEPVSSDLFGGDRPSSPLTTLSERGFSSSTPGSAPSHITGDPIIASSPWNYRLVGGLRKVPKTPDLKQKKTLYSSPVTESVLAPLPETSVIDSTSPALANKASFQSSQSASTTSETTNYKIYGSSSPALPALPDPTCDTRSSSPLNYEILGDLTSSGSNYRVLGATSSPTPSVDLRPGTAESEENYVVHGGDSSPSPSSVIARRHLRPEYSQESLIVPPLKTARKLSYERLGYFGKRSRESLRAGSLKSISSILSQETSQALFSSPTTVFLQNQNIIPGLSRRQQDPGAGPSTVGSPQIPMIQAHPHQWSSQLSTVVSESEGGSEPGTRSGSFSSGPGRHSSGLGSFHSRQMLSISSSLAAAEDRSLSRSQSLTDSAEIAHPSFPRAVYRETGVGSSRLIRDQDEHGDGLADLHELHARPSRSRLSGFFSSISSDRNLHSSSSSRANSFSSSSLPAWARLYYGSGERRFLAAPSDPNLTDQVESRPSSSFQSGSPSTEHLPVNIRGQRRRPREVSQHRRRNSSSASLNTNPLSLRQWRAGLRRQTSSIWSPHLQQDRRATRYSIWEPPSVNWSAESGALGRRNIQVVSFIAGFVFPFAWMVAALLPLPALPSEEMTERERYLAQYDPRSKLPLRTARSDEIQYRSARWWRQLNRFMAVLGVLIIGAIAALTVIGIHQGWAQKGAA